MRVGRPTILSLALIGASPLAAAAQPPQAPRAAPPVGVVPPPYAPGWQDGHVDVAAGDRLTLIVTRLPTGRGPRRQYYAANSAPPFPQFPRGAVIATIGDRSFQVESSRPIVASTSGHLRFAVNFATFETANPIPAFTVAVRRDRSEPAAAAPPTPPPAMPPTVTPAPPPPPTPPPAAALPMPARPTPPRPSSATPPRPSSPSPPRPSSPAPAPPAPAHAPAADHQPWPAGPGPADLPRGPRVGAAAGPASESRAPPPLLVLGALLALLAGAGLETGRRIRVRKRIRKLAQGLAVSPRLDRGEGGVTGDEIALAGPEVRLRTALEPGGAFFDGDGPGIEREESNG